ncbi:PD-(D/E)XK nuclease family protein [[Acholeplasma] multilocale]|uniref:PD-(D/E)XK nuclease family protein n=1 Tax=[Acholeplasma] multilocale TaxID=264638 RepID=UPI00047939CB|nr:PD-(D/E)XK nuclease family protein [[Acholeplasma] multilocale]
MKIQEYYANPLVKLNEETHEYYNTQTNEIIQLKSVTKLVDNLYPFNPVNIPEEALKAGIEKGICVHDRLSKWIINKDLGKCNHTYNGWPIRTHTSEFQWIKDGLEKIQAKEIYSEVSLSNGEFNGTFDLLYKDFNDKWHLVDFKTTSRLNKDKESLQLKFYEKLLTDIFEDVDKIDVFEIYNSKNVEHYSFDEKLQNVAEEKMNLILDKYL